MLTTFGTFWTGEGFSVEWPLSDAFLLILAAIYLGAAFSLVVWLKRVKKQQRDLAKEHQSAPTTAPKKEVLP
jgi:uncharacterized membrane protein